MDYKGDEKFKDGDEIRLLCKCPYCLDNGGFDVTIQIPRGEAYPNPKGFHQSCIEEQVVSIACPLCGGSGEVVVKVRMDEIEDKLMGSDGDKFLNWVRDRFVVHRGRYEDDDNIEWG